MNQFTMTQQLSSLKKNISDSKDDVIRLNAPLDIRDIESLLKQDAIVLIRNTPESEIDNVLSKLATKFGIHDNLELQAAFASSLGHRENISRYFMSVNQRKDFHFVPPHSEGSSFANIQLASFYCLENTTDGGETILMKPKQESPLWTTLKEFVIRAKTNGPPSNSDIAKARAMYRLNLKEDVLREDDKVLNTINVDSAFSLYEVLAVPVKSYSKILQKEINVFWDSMAAVDFEILEFTHRMLKEEGLLVTSNDVPAKNLDWDSNRRCISLPVDYSELFSKKIILQLKPGDLIIYNNFTWTHCVNNWTPGKGARKVVAAFA